MAEVALNCVSKVYDGAEQPAVHEVSESIRDGEFFVLVGPSGCGKSTLLKMLAGLDDPTSGEIRIDGRLCNHVSAGQRNVALVFQNYALYPSMTVARNIEFPLRMRGLSRQRRRVEVDRVVEMLALEQLVGRRVDAISGGQRQRVALARALVREPTITLMDEPLSNLDALLRAQTREELLRLHREVPGTVVYVTHDQVEAMSMGDRIGVMEDGRLVQVGTPRELYERPRTRFVAGFLGSPQMNLSAGELEARSDGVLVHAGLGVAVRLGASERTRAQTLRRTATLGVRPEAIRVVPGPRDEATSSWAVEFVEYLGHECVLVLNDGKRQIRARVNVEGCPAPGQTVGIEIASASCHLFDGEGARVDCEPASGLDVPPATQTHPVGVPMSAPRPLHEARHLAE